MLGIFTLIKETSRVKKLKVNNKHKLYYLYAYIYNTFQKYSFLN